MTFLMYGRGLDPDYELVKSYKISDMDSMGNPSEANPHYFGYVDVSCRWYITKLTNTSARYTRGDSDYDANWINRENLTYHNFQDIF